jgi:hypothetical protein
MADYLLAEEKDLIYLPEELLSYAAGAQVACGLDLQLLSRHTAELSIGSRLG